MGDEKPGAVKFLTDFSAGSRIAGYCLEEQIGHGGTAVVYRAQDERLPRQVALKILSPALAADDEFRHRFIRESRSAAAVDDPHIIPVYEAGDANGLLFIAMRYVPSGDAGTLVRRLGPLPIARAAAIISAVASALDAAHAAGLVHRDVKPANMLVDSRPGRPDHVYLSDFGLTKGALSWATQTGTGHFLGTPTYCAPEQIRGQAVDARADEYALACAAFMLLSGEPPFLRDEGMAVLYAHLSAPPPRLTERRQDLPAAVDDVLQRALAKKRTLGAEHPDTLATRFSIAREMSARGRHGAAEAEFRAVLAARQRTLGRNHPDTLAAWFCVAQEIAAGGKHAAAEEEFWDVLAARQRTLGPDHPDTLAAWFCVAQEMAARGDHAGAEDEFRAVLPHLERRLGLDHPVTLTLWFSIATEMAERGDPAGAAREFRGMLPYLRRRLGPDHPHTRAAAEQADRTR